MRKLIGGPADGTALHDPGRPIVIVRLGEKRAPHVYQLDQRTRQYLYAGVAAEAWNLRVAESLYPVLQGAEVALRCAIHREMTAHMRQADWFHLTRIPLTKKQREWVIDAERELEKQRQPVTAHSIVAKLSFGFWTMLMGQSLILRSGSPSWSESFRPCLCHASEAARMNGCS